jgi:hypothetical protein
MVHASISGILCGLVAGFCSLFVAFFLSRLTGITSLLLLIVCMIFPVVGLLAYFEKIFMAVMKRHSFSFPWYARLHGAVMALPSNMYFEHSKYLLQQIHPEKVGLEGDPLGHDAFWQEQKCSLLMTVFSFVGTAIGLFSAYRFIS